jgi:hypothetical protein
MSAKILLSTTLNWPSAARLAGSLASVGCEVDALFPAGHMLERSRYLAHGYQYRALDALASLDHAIGASRPDVIVPCDDRAVRHLLALWHRAGSRNQHDIAALIERSLGEPANYPAMMARSEFIHIAREAGIDTPDTVAVGTLEEFESQLQAFGLPAVLKVDGSWGGDGVALVRSRAEALAAWRRLSNPPSRLRSWLRAARRRDPHFLLAGSGEPVVSLQRFVAGNPATTAFACWKGEVLAAIHADVVVAQDATGPACVVKLVQSVQMDKAARGLARRFGLSGLHGLDYIRDGDGKAQLIEINPRATQLCHLALGEGGDLAAALASAVLSKPVAVRERVTANDVIALFPQEWRRDPQSAYLTSAYHDVPYDDPDVLKACLAAGKRPVFDEDQSADMPLRAAGRS